MPRSMIIATVLLGLIVGGASGVGAYTFLYAKGYSYLTNDPKACANCHVMQGHYEGWQRGSHHAVAVCNDCHTPHDLIGKYKTKVINGWHHSLAFTTGRFHEPIQVTRRNHDVTEAACRGCHEEIVQMIDLKRKGNERLSCTRCHASVGHLE